MIDGPLLEAYRRTRYRVFTDPETVCRVDEHNVNMDIVLRQHGVCTAAFLTAWNPRSVLAEAARNEAAHYALCAEVDTLGLASLRGIGEAEVGDWPGEPSLLILGIGREQAEALSRTFEQNAFVWIEQGRAPALVLTP